ncbi:MAG: 6,7-dimethyl-8-ribityllumazine synthase [Patescibacteria group bacterium]
MKIKSSSSSKTGEKFKIAVILPRFNDSTGEKIFKEVEKTLLEKGVKKQNISLFRIPGALELPFTAKKIAQSKKFHTIIALGVIIEGGTDHYEHVCRETYQGLMQANLTEKIPTIFGVLTVKNIKQAEERIYKGQEFAESAIEMANFTPKSYILNPKS